MSQTETASQYAQALFLLEPAQEKQKKMLNSLETLLTAIELNRNVEIYLTHPQIQIGQKKEFLNQVAHDPHLLQFLLFLIAKRNMALLPEIFRKFRTLVLESHNQIEASLVTAEPVPQELLVQLQSRLDQHFQKKSQITQHLDPRIIGGAILLVGNRRVDYSIKGRLHKMKQSLLGAIDVT